jgi:hypothetical protein
VHVPWMLFLETCIDCIPDLGTCSQASLSLKDALFATIASNIGPTSIQDIMLLTLCMALTVTQLWPGDTTLLSFSAII